MNVARSTWAVRGAFAIVAASLGIWVGILIAIGTGRDLLHPGQSAWRLNVSALLAIAFTASLVVGYIGVRVHARELRVLAWLGPGLIVAGVAIGMGWVSLTSPTFVIRDASATVSVEGGLYAGGEFGGVCVSLPDRDEVWHLYADGNQTRVVMLRSGEAGEDMSLIGPGEPVSLRIRTQYLIGFFQGGENPPILRGGQVVAVDVGGWAGTATFHDGDMWWKCTQPRTIHARAEDMAP